MLFNVFITNFSVFCKNNVTFQPKTHYINENIKKEYNKMAEVLGKLVEKIVDVAMTTYDSQGIVAGQKEFSKIFFTQTANREDLSIEEKVNLIQEYKFLLAKNKNRFAVLKKAEKHLLTTAQPEKVEDSWIFNFWDKCGTISDETLQEIWGRVLAQEVNNPSTVSKRLLHNLSLMSVSDAENFSNLVRFCFDDCKEDIAHPLIFIKEHPNVYSGSKIISKILKELELFSLIETNYDTGFIFENKKRLNYRNCTFEIRLERIKAGNVRLTDDGQCLYKIVEKHPKNRILEYTIDILQNNGANIKMI